MVSEHRTRSLLRVDEDEQHQAQPITNYFAVGHFCSAAVACYLVIIAIHVVQNRFSLLMYVPIIRALLSSQQRTLYFRLAEGAKGIGMHVEEAGMEEDAPNQLLLNSLKSSILSVTHSVPS